MIETAYTLYRRLAPRLPTTVRRALRRLWKYWPDGTAAGVAALKRSGLFDDAWYLTRYPDVAASGVDAVAHYVRRGAQEGRDPCALFDTRYYVSNNPDVAALGINPLVHFCQQGAWELRNPSADFDCVWYWLTHLVRLDGEANPLVHYVTIGRKTGLEIRAAGVLSADERQSLTDFCEHLLHDEQPGSRITLRVRLALSRLSGAVAAQDVFLDVASLHRDDPLVQERLADVLARLGWWWQVVASLQHAIELSPGHAEWHFRLGEAHEHAHHPAQAIDDYRRAIELDGRRAAWYYRLGCALESAERADEATAAYAQAVRRDRRRVVKRFGVGMLHELCGRWPDAARAYAREVAQTPPDASLHFKLGMALDRCYRWVEAERAYADAIALRPGVARWHYRYGFVVERQQHWLEAAGAYANALRLSRAHQPAWGYRRAYALERAGALEQACLTHIRILDRRNGLGTDNESWARKRYRFARALVRRFRRNAERSQSAAACLQVVADHPTDPQAHYRLGLAQEHAGNWADAAHSYADAVTRSDPHRAAWYYRLGFALYRAGHLEEACAAFRQTRIIQRASGLDEAPLHRAGPGVQLSTRYAEYLETLPIRDNVIMYESHLGKSISCNPLAIFRCLIADPAFASYLHVWVIKDMSRVPNNMRHLPNVVFTTRASDLFLRYLATAKYFINNTNLPTYFVRRVEQKFLATWHGTPLKTLGKQQQYKFQEHRRTQRNFLQATHIISPNPHTTGVLLDSYDLRRIMGGKLAETGYPRVDLTLNADDDERAAIRKLLGVAPGKPIVLYAPTWRGTLQDVSWELERARSDIRHLAERHECEIIFRGHHLMERMLAAGPSLGCTVAPPVLDTNELLAVVDVLITDYSSVCFDFFPTGRPVLYYIYDLEAYQRDRGLYLSMDEMPGYKCHDIQSLDDALGHALRSELADPAHHAQARQRFNSHDDGNATRRVVDFFFHDARADVVDLGPRAPASVLFQCGGLKRNGITTSFLNLVKHIDRASADITVAISPGAIEYNPQCRESFAAIAEDVGVVARHGLVPMTWEERWLRERHECAPMELGEQQMAVMRVLFDREYRRVFGQSKFDVAVVFSGYDAVWGSILVLNRQPLRKVIYMHSDMHREYMERYPDLARMFQLYPYADALVSVCEQSNRVNRDQLSKWLGVAPSRFVVAENVQDTQRILALAEQAIEPGDENCFDGAPVFINVGRLSPEKGQARLIRAFARLHDACPSARLLILGVGPLRGALQDLAARLDLGSAVQLLGFRSNPYAYLRRSTCFVLASHYEAKTMALVEAMTLGIPFVATAIPGNRDIQQEFPDNFVADSEEGLLEGMRRHVAGDVAGPDFDWRRHQAMALRQFTERVMQRAHTCSVPDTQHGDFR